MNRETELKRGVGVFGTAFLVRLAAAAVTSVTGLNPESHADAELFGSTAAYIANGLVQGRLVFPNVTPTYELWGLFLAPFWLLPGPSGFYARVGNALLGAFAIYNVYLVARYYHSYRAGLLAAAPMAFYPSFVAVHSTLMREAFVLFGITTAARFILVPSSTRSRLHSYLLAGGALSLATIHREDNAIVYGVAIGIGALVFLLDTGRVSKRQVGAGALLSPVAFVYAYPLVRAGVEFLARIHDVRARGRTVYLAHVIPNTLPELLAFSWIGALYFLYTPFPWMIATPADLVVGMEALVNVLFTVAGVYGVKVLYHRSRVATVGLLVGFLAAIVLYGVGTVNFGTAMRHRQMFLWVVFLFGAVGLADRFRFVGITRGT